MAEKNIRLGDEIEDATAKVKGIVIGRVEYLDGNVAWLLQPPYHMDGTKIPIVEVQDAYAKYVGPGVRKRGIPAVGFHARRGERSP